MEAELVNRSGVPYASIPAAGVHGVGLRALPGNIVRLARGVLAARQLLKSFKPDVLLFTGGYVAVPMALAGNGIPSLLYVPDIEPGLALKTLARFASIIALTEETSRAYFSSRARTVVTGYPTRSDLNGWPRESARAFLGLDPQRKVLLISGGSKGARSINRAVTANLPALLQIAQVVHLTGTLDWPEIEAFRQGLSADQAASYHAKPYLHEMGAALAAADLIVSRAGASALGEYPLFGLPAILVPYPYAWRYQKVNASYLVERGAALMIENDALPAQILSTVSALMQDETRLNQMRQSMSSLAHRNAAENLANLVQQLASEETHA
jgi:UDP-N-acetylglucosamine--N-acetylmuramyl-(pentapeptide) pyrophosphoryl-undecaprenol N-acetylglucosamine transferase